MLIDEQRSAVQTFLSSPLIDQYEIRARIWLEVLTRIANTIDTWLQAQRLWVYFAPVFRSADLPQRRPHETRRFQAVDSAWRKLMESVVANPHVLAVCGPQGKSKACAILRECTVMLESIRTGLSKYLDGKRNAFSRLFFLSNEELLDILSYTKEPTESIPHLLKLFPFVSSVILRNTSPVETLASQTAKSPRTSPEKKPSEMHEPVISGVRMQFGESVNLQQSIRTLNVEPDQWLLSLQNSLQSSLRCQILTALFIISSNMKVSKDQLSGLRQRNKRDFSPDKLSPSKSMGLLPTGMSLQRSMTLSGLQNSTSPQDKTSGQNAINTVNSLIDQSHTDPSLIPVPFTPEGFLIDYQDYSTNNTDSQPPTKYTLPKESVFTSNFGNCVT